MQEERTELVVSISIHAPARGATWLKYVLYRKHFYFNPRTREGCDEYSSEINIRSKKFQSTHPRGVRLAKDKNGNSKVNFNPRTREGCDDVSI